MGRKLPPACRGHAAFQQHFHHCQASVHQHLSISSSAEV